MKYLFFFVLLVVVMLSAGCFQKTVVCGTTSHISINDSVGYKCCGEYYISSFYDNLDCCGGVVYNRISQHCCKGKILPDGGYWVDCGSSCINTTIQSCCNGEIFQGKGSYSTCGKTCYDKETQTCCENQVYQGEFWATCGKTCYDIETQSCCNKQVYQGRDRCCRNSGSSPVCSEGMKCCYDKEKGPTCFDPNKQWCVPEGFPSL